jgi:hypothetical protein
MATISAKSAVLLLCIFHVSGPLFAGPVEAPKPQGKLKIIVLEGAPYSRGVHYGTAVKDEIHHYLRLWKANLQQSYKMEADAFIKKFLARTDYVSAMKKWTPDLLEEVRGIADGAGVDFGTMLVYQWVDEYWVQGESVAAEHCSGLGVGRRGARPAMIAQNLDIEGFNDGFQVILHVKHQDSDLESFVFTPAGLIGANGMNNHAVGICANTLAQLDNCRDGLPVACVIRGALAQKTTRDAIAFLEQVKHASGQNYIIGGPDLPYSFECSAHKVSRFQPSAGSDVVWHTNHPLANDDYHSWYRSFREKNKNNPKSATDSEVRLECVKNRLEKIGGTVDIEAIKSILKSRDPDNHPVCRPLKNRSAPYTFGSLIMVLSDKPELHVAPGPPDVVPYQVLRF